MKTGMVAFLCAVSSMYGAASESVQSREMMIVALKAIRCSKNYKGVMLLHSVGCYDGSHPMKRIDFKVDDQVVESCEVAHVKDVVRGRLCWLMNNVLNPDEMKRKDKRNKHLAALRALLGLQESAEITEATLQARLDCISMQKR